MTDPTPPISTSRLTPIPLGCFGPPPRHGFRALVCESDVPIMAFAAVKRVTKANRGVHGEVNLG